MKRPAIFLDRDGVLNAEKSYITKLNQLEIFPYAKEAIDIIHECGFYAIVISNQSAIARGLMSEQELIKINNKIEHDTGVNAIYYCPHHPNGCIKRFSIVCECRKPKTGLIVKACNDFSIDVEKSYVVGDRYSDILVGQRCGLKTVMLQSGYDFNDMQQKVIPDFIFDDLKGFAYNLLNEKFKCN